jgi:hypothetical protein
MNKGSLEAESKKVAKHPKVKAEIERLRLALLPPLEDLKAVYDHAYAAVVRLSVESPDERLRFDACRWLRAEYEKQQQSAAEVLPAPAAETLEALRALYRQIEATATAAEPLTLDVEREGRVLEVTEATTPPEAVAGMSAAVEDTVPECASAEDELPDEPESGPMFRREPVAGTFPQQFRRVRVR